jgi:hypothetical protein
MAGTTGDILIATQQLVEEQEAPEFNQLNRRRWKQDNRLNSFPPQQGLKVPIDVGLS